jgi:protein-S-isoprenylcysteine O-methyltransferase Ste14
MYVGMKRIHRKRTKARRLLLGFLFLLGSPRILTLYIGLPMVIVGQLINLLTYGVLTKRDSLVKTGPYAWCRNPFYVGTFLTDFGFVAMCNPSRLNTLIILIGYAVVQITFYYQQMFREEKLLRGMHGEEYEDYCRKVRWRLLPSPVAAFKYGGIFFRWSARLALHNKIYSRVISAGFWVIAFWALSIATGNGTSFLLSFKGINFWLVFTNLWLMLTASAVTAVYILFRILEWKNRQKEDAQKAAAESASASAGSGNDMEPQ